METKTVMMPRELTAENGAKAALGGEFFEKIAVPCPECLWERESLECDNCDSTGKVQREVMVSWTTIKAIYAMAVVKLGT